MQNKEMQEKDYFDPNGVIFKYKKSLFLCEIFEGRIIGSSRVYEIREENLDINIVDTFAKFIKSLILFVNFKRMEDNTFVMENQLVTFTSTPIKLLIGSNNFNKIILEKYLSKNQI